MSWTLHEKGLYWYALNKASGQLCENDSWTSVPFFEKSKHAVPNSPGIYMISSGISNKLFSKEKNKLAKLFFTSHYVGKAVDLKRRFGEHLTSKKEEIRDIIDTYADSSIRLQFMFLKIIDEEKLDILERLAFKCFRPDGNVIDAEMTMKNLKLYDQIINRSRKELL